MKTPRLIPIVIVAASALLVFKSIGLLTGGGYVLVGTQSAMASGSGGGGEAAPAEGGGDPSTGPTIEDASPTLADTAKTVPLAEAVSTDRSGAAAEPAAAGEGGASNTAEPAATDASAAAAPADAAAAAPTDPSELPYCPPEVAATAEATAEKAAASDQGGSGTGAAAPVTCRPAVDANGMPLVRDGTGAVIPMVDSSVGAAQPQLIERLGERRDELAAQQSELDMRAALVDAAEKRLDARAAELKALEGKINGMLDQQQQEATQQYASLVAMYQAMKPKEAATIFDALDMPVLVGIAKAMSPQKMGPILARMTPDRAKALTAALAAGDAPVSPATADATGTPATSGLPQIVGQ